MVDAVIVDDAIGVAEAETAGEPLDVAEGDDVPPQDAMDRAPIVRRVIARLGIRTFHQYSEAPILGQVN